MKDDMNWFHKNSYGHQQYTNPKERGVSKKERRRRKNALIDAIDTQYTSADEAMKALKEELVIKGDMNATSQEISS